MRVKLHLCLGKVPTESLLGAMPESFKGILSRASGMI